MRSKMFGGSVALGLILGFAPVLSLAADKPTPDEARKVIDYYYHGKGMGPVLMETKICRDIQREGDEKNECAGDVTGQALKKGESAYVWMAYMAPSGGEPQNVIVQYEINGVTRAVKNAQFTGLLRGRNWQKYTFDKAGTWKIKIIHDTGSGSEELGAREVTVE